MPRRPGALAACGERRAARPAGPREPQMPAARAACGVQPLPPESAARLHHFRVRHARGRERRGRARARTGGCRAPCTLQVQPDSVQSLPAFRVSPFQPGADPALRRDPAARRPDGHDAQDPRRRHRGRLRPACRRCGRPHAAQCTAHSSERGARVKRLLYLVLLALAGCAGQTSEPSVDTGTIVGEVGEPRNRAKIHTELAAQYYSRGNMGVALEELRIAAAADASYAPTQSMFGLVYMDLRANQLAESSFERALRLSPNDPDINHNYGVFLCQTQREGQAIASFLQAIRNPLYAAPWKSYSAPSVCQLLNNNVNSAEKFFKRALRLDPDEPISLLSIGQIRYP